VVDSVPTDVMKQEDDTLFIPQFNHLHEDSIVLGEDDSNVTVTVIPVQNRVTLQILIMCQLFKVLKQTIPVSRRAEQLRFRGNQRVFACRRSTSVGYAVKNALTARFPCPA
jgi:hypothetical protein